MTNTKGVPTRPGTDISDLSHFYFADIALSGLTTVSLITVILRLAGISA